MRSLIFISSALQQPRHQKRIDILQDNYSLNTYYFFRNKYIENYKDYEKNAINIGEIKDGSTVTRILMLSKLYRILIFHKSDLVYCTSPDQALVAILAFKKVILEIGDLYQINGNNNIYQILDRFILPSIKGLVITSPYYYDGYLYQYKKKFKNKPIVVENKLAPNMDHSITEYRSKFKHCINNKSIKLGVIGNLSFEKPLKLISSYLRNTSNVELHIYGDGLFHLFEHNSNSFYHGRFKSPEDLSDIYSKIDINIILYDYDNNNVKLAMPNKLYESIAYLKPIVCAEGVALSDYVIKNKIGVVVKDNDIKSAVDTVIDNYDFYIQNMKNMSKKSYLCFEQEEILKLIDSI